MHAQIEKTKSKLSGGSSEYLVVILKLVCETSNCTDDAPYSGSIPYELFRALQAKAMLGMMNREDSCLPFHQRQESIGNKPVDQYVDLTLFAIRNLRHVL